MALLEAPQILFSAAAQSGRFHVQSSRLGENVADVAQLGIEIALFLGSHSLRGGIAGRPFSVSPGLTAAARDRRRMDHTFPE